LVKPTSAKPVSNCLRGQTAIDQLRAGHYSMLYPGQLPDSRRCPL